MNVVLRHMELMLVWWGGMGWGLHSHFHLQPNYSVEVVLHCVVVGVVTTYLAYATRIPTKLGVKLRNLGVKSAPTDLVGPL